MNQRVMVRSKSKVRRTVASVTWLWIGVVSVGYGEVISLDELLREVDRAPDVGLATLELEASTADVQRRTAAQSWEFFGGAGIARISEAVDDTRTREHTDLSARIGLRYPLLGGNRVDRRALHRAEGEERINAIKLDESQQLVGRQVTKAYGQYWAAQNIVTLTDAYAQFSDEIKKILALRREAGLLLESDQLELIAGFERVHQMRIHHQSQQQQALAQLTRLTGKALPAFEAVTPTFYEPPLELSDNDLIESTHPELQIIEAELKTQKELLEVAQREDVYADFVVSSSVTDELSGPSGYGLYAGVNFRMPLFYGEYKSADEAFVESNIRKSEASHLQRRDILVERARINVDLYRDYVQLLRFSLIQWDALSRVLEERSMRAQRLDGDVLSALVGSMHRYFSQSVDLFELQKKLWAIQAELSHHQLWAERLVASESIDVPEFSKVVEPIFASQRTLMNKTVSSSRRQKSRAGHAVYLWHSQQLMVSENPAFWQQFKARRITKLLVSLNGDQIEAIAADPKPLVTFLSVAEQKGVAVSLLLGDPGWALSDQRNGLFDIIYTLRELPFDGLNLDIEPDSLGVEVTESLLRDWIETIRLANMLSPWPLEVTMHHRYLTAPISGFCVTCELASFGVSNVSVMVFVTNPERVVDIVEPALVAHPPLRISVVQSFERHLSREESYASFTEQDAQDRIARVEASLGRYSNFGGVAIQSWSDMKRSD